MPSGQNIQRTECQALGPDRHSHAAHGFLPTGGWGYGWVGDPDLGFGRSQPGGWPFSLLPYLEQPALHSLGAGNDDIEKTRAVEQLASTPLTMFSALSSGEARDHSTAAIVHSLR